MKKGLKQLLLIIALVLFAWPGICPANQVEEGTTGDTTFTVGSWNLEWIPGKTPYPAYIADPRRPRMHAGFGYSDSEIPAVSSGLIDLDAGTRIAVLKMQRSAEGANEYTLDLEGGIFTRFNMINGLYNVGWDGRYGVYLAWNLSDITAARIGYRHISAHLGDQYIEETERTRIGYIRDDLRIGLGFRPVKSLLVYVEPSCAFHMGNSDRQELWALEGGVQYQGPYTVWKNSMAWYGGMHLASWQENGWNPSIACQAGFELKRDPKQARMRLGIEAYTGRAILGEFALDYNETYITAGIFFDFF